MLIVIIITTRWPQQCWLILSAACLIRKAACRSMEPPLLLLILPQDYRLLFSATTGSVLSRQPLPAAVQRPTATGSYIHSRREGSNSRSFRPAAINLRLFRRPYTISPAP